MDDRIVVPKACRKAILDNLHSAHQGVTGMTGRAHQTVYWPGLDADIRNTRYTCTDCNGNASNSIQVIQFISQSRTQTINIHISILVNLVKNCV